jgi:hypothetical protein
MVKNTRKRVKRVIFSKSRKTRRGGGLPGIIDLITPGCLKKSASSKNSPANSPTNGKVPLKVNRAIPVTPANPANPVTPANPATPVTPSSNIDDIVKKSASYSVIDAWVEAKIKKGGFNKGDENVNTPPVGKLHFEVDKDGIDDNLFGSESNNILELPGGTNNYERMFSSGNDNDCLIHSILTAVSKSFRTLTKDDKDKIASYFRRTILVDIFNAIKTKKAAEKPGDDLKKLNDSIKELNEDVFLDDFVAGQFGERYKLGILIRDRTDPITKWNLTGYDNSQYIMIHNPGKNHFEAIRYNKTNENKYLFDIKELDTYFNLKNHNKCEINGDPIIQGNVVLNTVTTELYSVVEVTTVSNSCSQINVIPYETTHTKAILEGIAKTKPPVINILPNIADYYKFAGAMNTNECVNIIKNILTEQNNMIGGRSKYDQALSEINSGQITNDLIRVVWPMMKDVMQTKTPELELPNILCARQYLLDKILRDRLITITNATLKQIEGGVKPDSIYTLFGKNDWQKNFKKFALCCYIFKTAAVLAFKKTSSYYKALNKLFTSVLDIIDKDVLPSFPTTKTKDDLKRLFDTAKQIIKRP